MAFDLGCVLIPADLATTIASTSEMTGWLGGGLIDGEHVYVIVSAVVGDATKYSPASARLASHAAFLEGSSSERLLRWFRIDREKSKQFKPWNKCARSEIAAALGYSLPDGREYVCFIEPTEKEPKVRPFCLLSEGDDTLICPVEVSVLFRAEPFRHMKPESLESLNRKKVAIVGLGSGGSETALQLACSGVGELIVFDDDRLYANNLVRHLLNRRNLARLKINALVEDLKMRDLPTRVTTYPIDVVLWADQFRTALSEHKPDLIICATDSRESRRFVNYVSVRFQLPLVIAGVLDDGRIGEVLYYVPSESACYECTRLQLGASLIQPSMDERPAIPYVGGESLNLQSGTYRFDVGFVSSLTTRVALSALDPNSFERPPRNYVLWGREKTDYDEPFRFEFPLSISYVTIVRQKDCPVCGDIPTELKNVQAEDRAAEILAEANEIPE